MCRAQKWHKSSAKIASAAVTLELNWLRAAASSARKPKTVATSYCGHIFSHKLAKYKSNLLLARQPLQPKLPWLALWRTDTRTELCFLFNDELNWTELNSMNEWTDEPMKQTATKTGASELWECSLCSELHHATDATIDETDTQYRDKDDTTRK